MATKLSKIETLQEAKERVRKVFRPSDEDPVVRFIGENGKMGLRHLISEEVVEAPTQDVIEMPEAEVIEPVISEKDQAWNQWRAAFDEAEKHVPSGYKWLNYDSEFKKHYPPFDSLFIVEKDGLQGVINTKGEVLVPAIYTSLAVETWWDKKANKNWYLPNVLYMTKGEGENETIGYVSLDGKELVANKAESDFDEDKIRASVLALNPDKTEIPGWGYRAGDFSYSENGKYGLKLKGKKVTDAIYTEIEYRYLVGNKPLFKVRGKGEYGDDDIAGVVDETGNEILPCKYDKSEFRVDENRGLIFTRKKKKEGVFDLEGKAIVKCAYRPCELLEDVNVFAGYTSKDVTLFNYLGQIIIDKGQYDKIKTFSKDGLLYIRSIDCKWWYIDLWGNKKQE